MRDLQTRATLGLKHYLLTIALLIICYMVMIIPFTSYMRAKPIVEKLGLVPKAELLQLVSADQKQLVGMSLTMKVLMYFGGLMEKLTTKFEAPPDYMAMSRLIHAAVKLDPYNMDAYYFVQSILVWDVNQPKVANALLDYGMKYRTWDWQLPFFAGFNCAFFLKDYKQAAKYYRMVGDLTGEDLFINLAGRYMHESGETELAAIYLATMVKSAKNPAIKKSLTTRLQALEAVRSIEIARDAFHRTMGRHPASVEELKRSGFLKQLPDDPYGGQFYLEPDGKVQTTSKFAFAREKSKIRQ